MVTVREGEVGTRHGRLALVDSGGAGPAVLLLHGHSSCKEVFHFQVHGDLGRRYRMLALDLPGHGQSDDAADPAATYSVPGYADAACQALAGLGIARAAVIGWSLGGHVGIEMIGRFPGLAGVMAIGTPPVDTLASQETWSEAEVVAYVGEKYPAATPLLPVLLQAARRADGRARSGVFQALLKGPGWDQCLVAETSAVPLAMVCGEFDASVNPASPPQAGYANLWRGEVLAMAGLGPAPFLEAPERFDFICGQFLDDALRETSPPLEAGLRAVDRLGEDGYGEYRIDGGFVLTLLATEWEYLLEICESEGVSVAALCHRILGSPEDTETASSRMREFMVRFFRRQARH